jgi:hypothetical protein
LQFHSCLTPAIHFIDWIQSIALNSTIIEPEKVISVRYRRRRRRDPICE